MHFKRLKELREEHEYTQEYIAFYLKINRIVYIRYENDNREIPVSFFIKLAKRYDVSLDYIVENEKTSKV